MGALQRITGAAIAPPPSFAAASLSLQAFETVPRGMGIATVAGEVVVYADDLSRTGPIENAYYVVEYQSLPGGMSWETFRRIESERITTSREVIRLERRAVNLPGDQHKTEMWQYRHFGNFWVTGPLPDHRVCDQIVGRVVGIFRPRGVA